MRYQQKQSGAIPRADILSMAERVTMTALHRKKSQFPLSDDPLVETSTDFQYFVHFFDQNPYIQIIYCTVALMLIALLWIVLLP